MKIIFKIKILISLLLFVFNNPVFGQKNKLVPCQKGWDNYCFCDSAGKVVFKGQWEYVSNFNHGFAFVRNKKRSGYIDSTGKYESNCHFSEMGRFYNGYTWASNKVGEIDIINKKCEVKFSMTHTWGEHGAAFFDSIIIIYALNEMNECGNTDNSYGAVDYNFNIVIPFSYVQMLKSSSDRYYFVSKSAVKMGEGDCPTLWGIYDIIDRKEIVPCVYKGSLGGQFNSEMTESTYSLESEEGFFKEMDKLKISLPLKDEISNQINGMFNW
jgi:hypothetical protein